MTETAERQLLVRALIEETARKSALLWVRGRYGPARPLWHVWHEGAVCLVTGPGEQPIDGLGLSDGGTATVTARGKDKGARLVVWTAKVVELEPRSEAWRAAVGDLRGKRLNATDSESLVERWAAECHVLRLEPTGESSERPGAVSERLVAAVPSPTPATTRQPMPAGLAKSLFRRR